MHDVGNRDLKGLDWIIIGAMTGPKAIKPKVEWVKNLIMRARDLDIPIFLKDNLKWHESVQQFPNGQPNAEGKGSRSIKIN